MEAAGVFAAAETRGYSAAAAFVVADLLADTGWSGVTEIDKGASTARGHREGGDYDSAPTGNPIAAPCPVIVPARGPRSRLSIVTVSGSLTGHGPAESV